LDQPDRLFAEQAARVALIVCGGGSSQPALSHPQHFNGGCPFQILARSCEICFGSMNGHRQAVSAGLKSADFAAKIG
jgi:hypothetical protein